MILSVNLTINFWGKANFAKYFIVDENAIISKFVCNSDKTLILNYILTSKLLKDLKYINIYFYFK
ncbi:MAG: hypothetical protein CMP18_01365 [Rickettsiales bacterium]|nr:hypothetical protein [Rickettsiales bacterium]